MEVEERQWTAVLSTQRSTRGSGLDERQQLLQTTPTSHSRLHPMLIFTHPPHPAMHMHTHTTHTHTHTLLSERYCLLIPCSPPAILVHGPHGHYPLNERTSELFLDLRQSWNGLHLDNHPCRSTAGHCREQGREGGGVEGDGGENATVLAQLLSS